MIIFCYCTHIEMYRLTDLLSIAQSIYIGTEKKLQILVQFIHCGVQRLHIHVVIDVLEIWIAFVFLVDYIYYCIKSQYKSTF